MQKIAIKYMDTICTCGRYFISVMLPCRSQDNNNDFEEPLINTSMLGYTSTRFGAGFTKKDEILIKGKRLNGTT
jgi:hypothetical protein